MATVLTIVDAEVDRELLRGLLEQAGYRVLLATTATDALRLVLERAPSVVLLDVDLRDMDGLELIERIREMTKTPIIAWSVPTSEERKIRILDRGADDYVTKPFANGELLARLRVAHRHATHLGLLAPEPVFVLDGLRIDFFARRVCVDGRQVHLTPTEYRLLAFLARHADQVISHDRLLEQIWGATCTSRTAYLRVYMRQLRQKLEKDPSKPRYLLNEPGVGYRLRFEARQGAPSPLEACSAPQLEAAIGVG